MKHDPDMINANGCEETQRWLAQANHVLEVARKLCTEACYAESCFYAGQTAQLALKAFLYSRGEDAVRIPSVKYLAEQCAEYEAVFHELTDAGRVLDQYYIATRYPDAFAFPGVPYESYTEPQAKEATDVATRIFNVVKQEVGG